MLSLLPLALVATISDTEVRAHLSAIDLPRGFHAVIEPPFVVIGDEPIEILERRAEGTVRWAMSRLRELFPRDPDRVLEIWLFKDAESYRRNTLRIFGERPDTPYGYYSPRHGALIMNIATGGGTLVHELVHPLVAANFPECPPWLNEGLGSLYEHSTERDGKIVGLPNWRLPGLQRAIERRAVPSFAELMSADSNRFYGEDQGTNYAQARYLLYYLQSRRLLRTYYARFAAAHAKGTDRTGLATLIDVLQVDDVEAFQHGWERWVLNLEAR